MLSPFFYEIRTVKSQYMVAIWSAPHTVEPSIFKGAWRTKAAAVQFAKSAMCGNRFNVYEVEPYEYEVHE